MRAGVYNYTHMEAKRLHYIITYPGMYIQGSPGKSPSRPKTNDDAMLRQLVRGGTGTGQEQCASDIQHAAAASLSLSPSVHPTIHHPSPIHQSALVQLRTCMVGEVS